MEVQSGSGAAVSPAPAAALPFTASLPTLPSPFWPSFLQHFRAAGSGLGWILSEEGFLTGSCCMAEPTAAWGFGRSWAGAGAVPSCARAGAVLLQLVLPHPAFAELPFLPRSAACPPCSVLSLFLFRARCPGRLSCEAGVMWEESHLHLSCPTTSAAVGSAGNCL